MPPREKADLFEFCSLHLCILQVFSQYFALQCIRIQSHGLPNLIVNSEDRIHDLMISHGLLSLLIHSSLLTVPADQMRKGILNPTNMSQLETGKRDKN